VVDTPRTLPAFVNWPSFPFEGQLRVKRLDPPAAEEPPRDGEDPETCAACNTADESYIWVSERWRVRALDAPSGLPMVLILETRSHLDIGDLPNMLAAEMGVMTVRLERAIRSLDDVARVHVNRWGDGAAHLHLWFLARPVGQLQMRGSFLSMWDDILDPIPEDRWRESLAMVAAWLGEFGGQVLAEPPRIQWLAPSSFAPAMAEEAAEGDGSGDAGLDVLGGGDGEPTDADEEVTGDRAVEPAGADAETSGPDAVGAVGVADKTARVAALATDANDAGVEAASGADGDAAAVTADGDGEPAVDDTVTSPSVDKAAKGSGNGNGARSSRVAKTRTAGRKTAAVANSATNVVVARDADSDADNEGATAPDAAGLAEPENGGGAGDGRGAGSDREAPEHVVSAVDAHEAALGADDAATPSAGESTDADTGDEKAAVPRQAVPDDSMAFLADADLDMSKSR
jgi:hypothetical protein